MKKKVIMGLGLLLLAAALCLGGYNLWDNARAGQQARDTAERLLALPTAAPSGELSRKEEAAVSEPPQTPEQPEEPAFLLDGEEYLGILEIPELELELPVFADWDYEKLRSAPCRYSGTLDGGLVLAGHNYAAHFGRLGALPSGAEVRLTTADGETRRYWVEESETLAAGAVEEMTASGYDLTLFTCTLSGAARVAVRCRLADD